MNPALPKLRAAALMTGASLLAPAAPAGDAPRGIDLHIGASLLRFDFREYADASEELVRELGVLPGVVAGVGQTIGRWRWSTELSYHGGAVDYDGQTQAGATFTTKTDATVAEVRARALRFIDEGERFAAGFGLAYRQWRRHIRGRGTVGGLDERYSAGDLSVDARVSMLRGETTSLDLDLRLAWPIRPEVRVDFGGRFDTKSLPLGSRLAARVSAPAAWVTGPHSRLVVEPGFEAWGFGRSDTETLYRDGVPVGVVYQPQGKGYNLDVKLVWVQSF